MSTHIHLDPNLTSHLSQKTGLAESTVTELLNKGWRYVEKIGEVSRWEHPMWNLNNPI